MRLFEEGKHVIEQKKEELAGGEKRIACLRETRLMNTKGV